MNRKIKFRAWRKNKEIMLDWETIKFNNSNDLFGGYFQLFNREEFIPMQFTGLKDKNGKEIYEGDIMFEKGCWTQGNKYYNHEGQFHIVKVETLSYGDEFGVIDALGYNKEYKDMEIIGNIYKNSDLLNQEESPELLEENEKENTRR